MHDASAGGWKGRSGLLAGVLLVGLVLRVLLAAKSLGSNDMAIWARWGAELEAHSLRATYQENPAFNHPVLAAVAVRAVWWLAKVTSLRFELIFRLLTSVADLVVAALLMRHHGARDRVAGRVAFACYWLSPAAMLLSAFHGNTDPWVVVPLVAAVLAAAGGRAGRAGLWLGLAANVKVVPLLFLPSLGARVRTWASAGRLAAGFAAGAAALVLALGWAGPAALRNVFAYASNFENWGIGLFARGGRLEAELSVRMEPIRQALLGPGRWALLFLLGVVALVGFLRRRSEVEVAACMAAAFLVFTPGFGVQYLAYAGPLLLLCSLRWGTAFAWAAGAFLLLAYGLAWGGSFPATAYFYDAFPRPVWLAGLFVWGLLLAFLGRQLWLWLWPRAPGPAAG